MNFVVRYIIMPADNGWLRLSKTVPGTHGSIVVEHSTAEGGPWKQLEALAPESKAGYVSYTLGLLRLLGLLVGSTNGYIRGSEEEVKALKDLLRSLG